MGQNLHANMKGFHRASHIYIMCMSSDIYNIMVSDHLSVNITTFVT